MVLLSLRTQAKEEVKALSATVWHSVLGEGTRAATRTGLAQPEEKGQSGTSISRKCYDLRPRKHESGNSHRACSAKWTEPKVKPTILNVRGRVWTMVASGGASVVLADTVRDYRYGHELANYGEYSDAPSKEEICMPVRCWA